jgi:hypothetical protein
LNANIICFGNTKFGETTHLYFCMCIDCSMQISTGCK